MSTPEATPEKTTELVISQTEQRFREVFERSPAGVARVGLDGTWLELNDKFCEMLGYKFEELIHIRPWELIHPEDLARNLTERERLISGEAQQVSLETRYLRKDGSVAWIARTASLVRDASGTPQYFVVVGQDITARKQSEERLRDATELSSRAMAASRIAMFRWDLRSGKWKWDRPQPMLPVSDEVLSTLEGLLALVVPEDRRELFERLSRSAKEGVGFDHEFRAMLPPEETVAWFYARGSIVRDKRGHPAYLTGAVVNMTEYKLLRRELQDRQELLLLAESAGGVHPWAVDAITSRRVWWTPASYRLYRRKEELGPPTREEFIKLVHPEDQEKIREVYQALHKSGGGDSFSVQFRTSPTSGEVRWIHAKGRIHRDTGGWPLRLVGVDVDVTERRQAEEALRESERRFRSFFETMAVGMAELDVDGHFLHVNKRFCEITGYGEEELQGMTPEDLAHPEDRKRERERLGLFLSGDLPNIEIEIRNVRKDGSIIWVQITAMVIPNDEGKPLRFAGITQDITDRKRSAELLFRTEKLAVLGRMAETIAHEVNNPLEAAMNLQFLAMGVEGLPESARHLLEMAEIELNRVAHVTRQSLGFYHESTAPTLTSIGVVLDSAIDLQKSKIKAKHANIDKQWSEDVRITAVVGELRQVFSNLISNSLDAIDERGVIKLRVSAHNDRVRITVSDNGKGIPPSTRQHIFEPFYTTKERVGTGLALWVGQQIVEKHRGTIRVRSRSDGARRGTTFSVVLPVSPTSENRESAVA